jgi:hypothetical protein
MRELIIIVFKINIQGLSRQQAEQNIYELMESYNLSDDEDLKENYIIKQIWLPIEGESDVKVIYPISQTFKSCEIDELVNDINERLKKSPDGVFVQHWKNFLRKIKLENIKKINE